MEYTLTWLGQIPSKKNAYTPRKDRPGVFKNQALRDKLDRLAIQIPGELRWLRLEHCDVSVQIWTPVGNFDRDNTWTTIQDLLVSYQVLAGDQIARFNGRIEILPARWAEDYRTDITLRVNEENKWDPPKKSRRQQRRLPS